MNTVAIVGTGLIGASFGLALREAGFGGSIIGVSSARAIAEAQAPRRHRSRRPAGRGPG